MCFATWLGASWSNGRASAASGASGSGDKFNDFWETLLRLDTQISASKADKGKGKGVARSLSGAGGSGSSSLNVDDPSADGVQGAGASPEATFQASAFGQVSRNSLIKNCYDYHIKICEVGRLHNTVYRRFFQATAFFG